MQTCSVIYQVGPRSLLRETYCVHHVSQSCPTDILSAGVFIYPNKVTNVGAQLTVIREQCLEVCLPHRTMHKC